MELPDYVRRHRESLVMKPKTDHGGRDVYIGAEVDADSWEEVIDEALSGDWVVRSASRSPRGLFR